jgi:endonuclease-3
MAAHKESRDALAARAKEIATRLIRAYPDARCRLDHSSPFQLLAATILSAQCTDDMVNKVTPALFKEAPDAAALAGMNWQRLETLIRSTGFYRNKRKSLQGMARMLVDEFGGRVPQAMDDLVRLPGVARKTANVVRAVAFGRAAIVTDTHFIRLSRRMGLADTDKPEKVERAVMDLLPEGRWSAFSHAMLFHGRAVCGAKKPACDACPVSNLCPSAFRFPHFAGKGD